MPSSRAARMMRTAISPRLAMSNVSMAMPPQSSNFDFRQRLAGHHGIFVLGRESDDPARLIRLHLVEGFHHLDEADDVADRHMVAFILVGRLIGRGLSVESSRKRRQESFDCHSFPSWFAFQPMRP